MRTSPAERYAPPLWQRIAWALSLAMLVSAVTLTLFADRRGTDAPAATPQPVFAAPSPTLAVLPFVNLSAEADTDYPRGGESEELRDTLARSRGPAGHGARARRSGCRDAQTDVREARLDSSACATCCRAACARSTRRVRIDARLTDATIRPGNSGAAPTSARWRSCSPCSRRSPRRSRARSRWRRCSAQNRHCRGAHRQRRGAPGIPAARELTRHLGGGRCGRGDRAPAARHHARSGLCRRLRTTGRRDHDPSRSSTGASNPCAPPSGTAAGPRAGAGSRSLGEAYVMRGWLIDDPALQERELRKGLELSPNYARGYEMLASQLMACRDGGRGAAADRSRAGAGSVDATQSPHQGDLSLAQLGDIDGAEELERRALRARSALSLGAAVDWAR